MMGGTRAETTSIGQIPVQPFGFFANAQTLVVKAKVINRKGSNNEKNKNLCIIIIITCSIIGSRQCTSRLFVYYAK